MLEPFCTLNWYVGWSLVLAAFITGVGIGLQFHQDDFWGGYNSFRRRAARLGHIALAALGMLNLLFSLSPWPIPGTEAALIASWGFIIGGVTMPAVCFLTAWRRSFRNLYFVPVIALITAVVSVLMGTSS